MAKLFSVEELSKMMVGEIKATGRTEIDLDRLENIDSHENLIFSLVHDLIANVHHDKQPEASIEAISKKSKKSLVDIRDVINDIVEE